MEKQRPKVGSAVLVEKEGKFLLGKRNKRNYFGYWVIPGGGVKWGETIREAAIREIKEETGLDVELVRLICHEEILNLPENYHTVTFFHLAKPKHMNLKPSDDISEADFFSVEEIKKMKISETVEWVLKKAGFWK
jgi:8-oxo-dGTP diphosphatase